MAITAVTTTLPHTFLFLGPCPITCSLPLYYTIWHTDAWLIAKKYLHGGLGEVLENCRV
jgi:hypothetical protein